MFEHLDKLPDDPILGVMAQYRADPSEKKVDLGAGVYKDSAGHTPIMRAVARAEELVMAEEDTKAYLGMAGNLDCNRLMQALLFGSDHAAAGENRLHTLQTPGGSGGLRVAAEFLASVRPDAKVWIGDPSWANHIPLIGSAGLEFQRYHYYDAATHQVQFDSMIQALSSAPAGDLVLLHGCCHNPTGADLTRDQWDDLARLCLDRGLVPFIDFAYQGFGEGLDDDAYGARVMADAVPEMIVVSSCSKNFGLYRERMGAVSVLGATSTASEAAYTHMLRIVRRIYSMPPNHGAAIVARILGDPALRADWETELSDYRQRMQRLRRQFADALEANIAGSNYDFLRTQKGMFSFLGVSSDEVKQLIEQHHIYLVASSRINVAGLSESNIDYVAAAVAQCVAEPV